MTTLCVTKPRPSCQEDGCENLAVATRYFYNSQGEKYKVAWRRFCIKCHNQRTAKKRGLSSMAEVVAKNAGFDTVIEYANARHPYLRYRKTYCENIDGRLGFVCTTVLPTQEQIDAAGLQWKPIQFLEVDHIDGNHTHNEPANLQTLCKCCHMMKSSQAGDHLTPGRKTRTV